MTETITFQITHFLILMDNHVKSIDHQLLYANLIGNERTETALLNII